MDHIKSSIEQSDLKDRRIEKIKSEYEKIDNGWLKLHYKLSIWLVTIILLIECVISIYVVKADMVSIPFPRYILKYLVVPSGLNLIFIAINTFIMYSNRFTQIQKIYGISIHLVLISSVIFIVHSIFIVSYGIFFVAIMLTVIYANFKLTTITSVLSMLSLIISEVFIVWDGAKSTIFGSSLRMGDFLVLVFMMLTGVIISLVSIRFEDRKNAVSIEMEVERFYLEQKLLIDEMTGIYNRKAFHNALKNMEETMESKEVRKKIDSNYILAMVDIDNFKKINDTWGHHIGDVCLIEFALVLSRLRDNYIPFRYGGDEFCLLFHNTEMKQAEQICKEIQLAVSELYFEEEPEVELTVSFGLAQYSEDIDTGKLFSNADNTLYEAKAIRNTVRIYQGN